MGKFIGFKTMSDDAWFYYNPENVLDTLRVVFVSECDKNAASPACAWHRFSDEAKNNRITAITVALTDISLEEVEFKNREACRINDDIPNLYDLFMVLHEHPSARLVHVLSRYADDITELDSDGDLITVEQLLKTFARFIEEDILDIEADLYSHANDNTNESSPVEVSKAFMKDQYDKHTDLVDAIEGARNYFNTDDACTRVNDDDNPVNHPKHYQASNGLEAIDCIEAFVEDLPGDIGYLIGNAIKYLCRFDKKGKPVEDLQKARWYIERAIKDIESRKM